MWWRFLLPPFLCLTFLISYLSLCLFIHLFCGFYSSLTFQRAAQRITMFIPIRSVPPRRAHQPFKVSFLPLSFLHPLPSHHTLTINHPPRIPESPVTGLTGIKCVGHGMVFLFPTRALLCDECSFDQRSHL